MPTDVMRLQEVAREGLCRSEYNFELRTTDDQSGDGFTIDGITAVYDEPTEIDSWEGHFKEEFAFGSLGRSIRRQLPKMQFDHGTHPLLGSLPLGRWTSMTEEPVGLHAVGRMSDNWLVEPFRQAIADEQVDGMSIRFSVVREVWLDNDGKTVKPEDVLRLLYEPGERGPLRRIIKEAKLSEAGPVVWPAYQQTSVGVRSKVTIDLGRLTDPDQRSTLARAVFLTDAADSNTDGPQIPDESHDVPSEELERSEDPQPVPDESPEEPPSAESRRRRDRIRAAAQQYAGYTLTLEGN
jgi:HK97 family phage prohead protease